MNCNKCGNEPKETDRLAWKCTSCGKAYGVKLSYLHKLIEKKNIMNTASLLQCKECGEYLDSGNEKIFWKCSCGNVQCGELSDYRDRAETINRLKEQIYTKNNQINSTITDSKQKSNYKNIKSKIKYLIGIGAIFVIVVIIGASFILSNRHNRTEKKNKFIQEKTISYEKETKESLAPYLEKIGNNSGDGKISESQEFFDKMSNLEIMGESGTCELKYSEISNTIHSLYWTNNKDVSEEEFIEFKNLIDAYYNDNAKINNYDKFAFEDKSVKTYYSWIDYDFNCVVLCFYSKNRINLIWKLDKLYVIASTSEYEISDKIMDKKLAGYLHYLNSTYEELGLYEGKASNTLRTRYPLDEAKFLGKKCSIFLWFKNTKVTTKPYTIQIICPSSLQLDEIKRELQKAQDFYIDEEDIYSCELDIPNTDLTMSIHKSNKKLPGEVFISKQEKSNTERKNDSSNSNSESDDYDYNYNLSTPKDEYHNLSYFDVTDDDELGEVWAMAQLFIKDKLKSPSSAKFPVYGDSNVSIKKAKNYYKVSGYVDAQNSFGVELRNAFIVYLEKNGSNYTLKNCNIY